MFKAGESALFLAPHSDDAELCCGGTISKMVSMGVHVVIVNVSLSTGSTKAEAWEASGRLKAVCRMSSLYRVRSLHVTRQNILEYFRWLSEEVNPDYVFIPSKHDTHQDHQTVAEEAFRAFKFGTILAWEAPWNNMEFSPTLFCVLQDCDIENKLAAVAAYKSQQHRFYFSPDYLVSWARMRGGQVNHKYAEVYEVVRVLA